MSSRIPENCVKERLLEWWEKNKRDFPWRKTKDPYRILVSEMMLQQTQAQKVVYYYLDFLKKFPDWKALAEAREDQVLKVCEGMGYYRRFHALQEIARTVLEKYQGKLPSQEEKLQALPGIGEYTAAAIAAFAFDLPVGALDGNIKRVLSRLGAISEPVDTKRGVEKLRSLLLPLLPGASSALQQALMDLGQLVCLPRKPHCALCPVKEACQAFKEGAPENYPVKAKRKPLPTYDVVTGIIQNRKGEILLAKRKKVAFLGGLWEFPGGKVEKGESRKKALIREFQEEVGVAIEPEKYLGAVQHAYSHFKVRLHVYLARMRKGRARALGCAKIKWTSQDRVRDYPLTAGSIKIFNFYLKKQG